MELRQLYYFVKVANREHVTRAAEELHVAQSAVSRQIHLLEEELGVKLFIPKGRNLQLTHAGKLFLKRAEAILADLDRAIAEIHELTDPEHGEVRLGFPHSLGTHLVPTVIAKFKKHHPGVRFHFRQGMYASLIRDVLSGELDLAFISPLPEQEDQLCGHAVLKENLLAIVPPQHPLAGEETIDLAQLKDEPFVLFREGYSLRPIVWEACLRAGFTPKIAFEGEETDTIRGLVAAGMGVSLLPEMALEQTGPLMPAKIGLKDAVTRTIGIIHRAGEPLPLVARVFHQYLLDYFHKEYGPAT
ncbi:MAG: LysR family transcriptional regulator [Thermobacillus sp. ZCTH02-B1]|uniref:LysR family transcriptional regulator n=1 Tax=Thermobacillus sp. ZCTH02-B1 TaxID=1858795 RepID=UPI000B586C5C|nr:LysR family transcriptional regulator [Thermobacillus sp. ZCTH02-B1]OUM94458.1 MAG: LysR family transcriptional regulator [Thermobacillus sp. ZCTH02-B1]